MRFVDEPAECPFTRQVTRGVDGDFRPITGPMTDLGVSGELDDLAENG